MDTEELAADYENEEFAKSYCKVLLEFSKSETKEFFEFAVKLLEPGKLKGTRFLDFGCGPTVHYSAVASGQFKEIVLAEYSQSNREQLKKWLKKDPDALDWTPIFRVMAEFLGYADLDKGVEELESRIRQAAKTVVPCDLLADNILPAGIGEFDVVWASYCLEACCFSDDAYKEGVKKLSRYVKKGGALVMQATLNCSRYNVYKEIKSFPLTEPLIRDAIKEAGFAIQEWYSRGQFETEDAKKASDLEGFACFIAIKQ